MLLTGINKTIFATADDELRPVMNGVYINIESQSITFVATDAHKARQIRIADRNRNRRLVHPAEKTGQPAAVCWVKKTKVSAWNSTTKT